MNPPLANLLVVDGGGTKTVAAIFDTHHDPPLEIGRAVADASNPHAVGLHGALDQLAAVITALPWEDSTKGAAPLKVLVGIAGCSNPHFHAPLLAWLNERFSGTEVTLTSDALLVLDDATPANSPYLLIAGTGSVAMGRKGTGELVRVGGWGHLVGDEGGAYWLGLQGARAALRGADGRGAATSLTAALQDHFRVGSLPTLAARLHAVGEARRPIAELARVVLDCAEREDPVSRELRTRAAMELTILADALIGQLDVVWPATSAPVLTLVGSLIVHSQALREEFIARLAERRGEWTTYCLADVPTAVAHRLSQRSS